LTPPHPHHVLLTEEKVESEVLPIFIACTKDMTYSWVHTKILDKNYSNITVTYSGKSEFACVVTKLQDLKNEWTKQQDNYSKLL